MNIVFYEVSDAEAKFFSDNLRGHRLTFYPYPLTESKPAPADADILSVFVESFVSESVMKKIPNLRHIAVRATGYDNVAMGFAKDKQISVSNVPSYGTHTVAEFTFALLLSLTRKVCDANTRVKELGKFSDDGLGGVELFGKKFGLLGTGRIGGAVAKIATAFGMEVLAFDQFPNKELTLELGIKYFSLEEVVSQSDFISLHLPYTPDTHHIINADILKLVKPSAFLINTARGGLVDTESLASALTQGKLAGCALDVLEGERMVRDEIGFLTGKSKTTQDLEVLLSDHVLMRLPNVLLTPHLAYYTNEAVTRILNQTKDNISKFVDKQPINLVT